MSRPYVKLESQNLIAEKRAELTRMLALFAELPGVVAVMLDGGMSRGYADDLSEIDVVVFLDAEGFALYEQTHYPVATGITMLDGSLFDTKFLSYEEEVARAYDSIALWDLSYAEILYDPDGKLAAMMEEKLQPVKPTEAGGLMFDAWWHYRLAGNIWIHRKDVLQGHYVLGNAVGPLLSALFICNGEYIPHEKWLVHMSRTLAWLPDAWDQRLMEMMLVPDASMEGLVARQAAIHRIWSEIDQRLCQQMGITGVDSTQAGMLEMLETLLAEAPMSIENWTAKYPFAALNSEPLHAVIYVLDGYIHVDRDRLLSATENDLYPWYLQVVQATRS